MPGDWDLFMNSSPVSARMLAFKKHSGFIICSYVAPIPLKDHEVPAALG